MCTRAMVGIGAFVAATALAVAGGCNGPTKAGQEARAQANDRMSLVSAQIHFDQARQSFESGQFDKAQREIQHAIERAPNMPSYHLLQGRIYLETHQLEPALDSFKVAADKDPKLADPHYFMGIVHQRWSDDAAAAASYAKAFELEPSKAQYLLAAAESLVALGEFDQATTLIESKSAYFEHNAALRQLRGQIALLQGDPKMAAALYGEARLLNPDDNTLLEQLLWAQYAGEQYGPCLESLKCLTERIKERRPDLIHLEARCLNMMGRGTEARELYIELTKLRPSDAGAWAELGTLAWDLGDYRRVAGCSVQIIALAPDRYEGYMLKGINERHRGNLGEAVKLFWESAQHAPDVALPHLLLGQTLEQMGDAPGAKLAYDQAAQADPNSAEAKELLRRLSESQRLSAAPTG